MRILSCVVVLVYVVLVLVVVVVVVVVARPVDQYFASQAVTVQPPAVRGRPRYQV